MLGAVVRNAVVSADRNARQGRVVVLPGKLKRNAKWVVLIAENAKSSRWFNETREL